MSKIKYIYCFYHQHARKENKKFIYSYEEKGQVQLTLDNSKYEWGKDDYWDKTQKLFMTMRVRVTEYEFL